MSAKPLKILEVAPKEGSTRLIAERLAHEWRSLGHEVRLLTAPRVTWRTALTARGERYDLVHTHFGQAAARFARLRPLLNAPVIATFHGFHSASRQKRAQGFTAVSRAVKDHYARHGVDGSAIAVIANAAFPQCPESPGSARAKNDQPQILRIGTVGTLSDVKNHNLLLDVFERVRALRPRLHLDIVGEGPNRAMLEGTIAARGLAGHVTLHGHVSDVASLYGDWDVYMQTSLNEGFCMPLLEAMTVATPVLTTPSRGPEDFITHGETGIIAQDFAPKSLAAALITLIDHPEERRRLGEAGRAAAARYRWSEVAARYIAHFLRVIDEGS